MKTFMRTLLVALAFVSTLAHAQSREWVARMPNKAGGTIVFLTVTGSCKQGHAVYGSTASGLMAWGCWITSDNHVLVFWNEGETRTSAFSYLDLEMNPLYMKKSAPVTPQSSGSPNYF